MAKDTDKTPLTEEQLTKRLAELEKSSADLDAREKAVKAREDAADKKEKDLLAREADLDKGSEEPAKPLPGEKFKFDGEQYKFRDSAPKSIRMNGKPYTQKQIAKDDDLLLELVGGNSSLIQKIVE